MSRPRVKQRKHKAPSQDNAASGSTSSLSLPNNQLDRLSDDDWDKVAEVLCDYLKLPNADQPSVSDLTTRSGLKKVYNHFSEIYKRIDDTYVACKENQVVRGGIVAIYVKMCADSILRNMLFHQGLLAKIVDLIDKSNSRHLALHALATVTKHGGSDIRKEISLQAPVMIKVLEDFPDDLYAAELAISTLAHAVTSSLDERQKPAAKYVKAFQLPKLIPLVLAFIKPEVSLPLLHHALELLGPLTHNCSKECLAFPDMADFLIACIRSADLHSRFYALGNVIHLSSPVAEKVIGDPRALMAAMRCLPPHLEKLFVDYGPPRCEAMLTLRSSIEHQKVMMQYAKDRDLYRLGIALAGLIPLNEFAISEGIFQTINKSTGEPEFVDVGMPFKMWVDALPVCAKAIRERGKAGEQALADMLDMKFFVIRSRIPEAIVIAEEGIERNPKLCYPYYIMTLGLDEEEGLRCAKKGLKCKDLTPFLNHALRARATEIAGNLALCRVQESNGGDRKWEQAQAFLTSALDDAQIYLSQAPPDMRHRKDILYWHMVLTLAMKGPELSTDLSEFERHVDGLKIADDFCRHFGIVVPKSQLGSAYEHIRSRYAAAAKKWGEVVAQLDSSNIDGCGCVLTHDKAEDRLAVWLNEVHDDIEDTADDPCVGSSQTEEPKKDPTELYQCSWCENPSAVLRKCGGCGKARYCDANCQKLAWSEHKNKCRPRETAGASA